ncbi:MAG: FadR family transcriptional regulator [Candidatus Omnitrophota bacterium]|nr:MAG: FadR family transcriptional regulator [Candidatus Omnitrophota bacterium]
MKTKEKRLPHNALSTEVANQICALIRRERLAHGKVLGTEADLARQFGVSRTVIREAVGQLRGLGIVTSRQGLGLCVSNSNAISTMAKSLAPMIGDKATWSKLCHMRFVLEVGTLPLAVERATADQIERMRLLAEEMYEMVKPGQPITPDVEESVARREIEFHQIIFDAAGCEFTEQFHAILGEYFHESIGIGPYSSLPTIKDMEDHGKLVEAIADKDVGKAVTILVDHIRNILYAKEE